MVPNDHVTNWEKDAQAIPPITDGERYMVIKAENDLLKVENERLKATLQAVREEHERTRTALAYTTATANKYRKAGE